MDHTKEHITDITEVDGEPVIQHLNNPVTDIPNNSEKQYLGAVTDVQVVGNNFYFSDGSAKVEVRVVS
ncbi:MAG: hypothetical protein EOO94_04635, partial [Pedobacter sp.]